MLLYDLTIETVIT